MSVFFILGALVWSNMYMVWVYLPYYHCKWFM
ncbi:hypothetical protein J2S74_001423 [Evansella vedderi]|uniref:ATP synthase F0 subunit 8 n=1 Tax=Evansella vedderi TaxID=38282 RepID=A0ABT9ZVA7_9BACI|nr:hypothetical protein [Evansella vedderi]